MAQHAFSLEVRRDAADRSEPLDCGCRDPWTCDRHRPDISPEAVLASVIHLGARGAWPLHDLRRAWPLARNSTERDLVHQAALAAMEVAA